MTTPDGGSPPPGQSTRGELRAATAPRRSGPVRRVLTWVGATALLLVVAVLGYAAFEYYTLNSNLQRSDVLSKIHPDHEATKALGSDTNRCV